MAELRNSQVAECLVVSISITKPAWYKVGVSLMRDDVYEGCKRDSPELMVDMGWIPFWTAITPLICTNPEGSQYITLKDLWAEVEYTDFFR
jgi:hypothetical protein